MRRAAAVAALLLLAAGTAAAQGRPRLELGLRSGADPPQAVVRLSELLADDRYLSAVRSGFPLYVAISLELREERALWDRSVDRWVYEYVVLHDPVRNLYVLEDPAGTEEIPDSTVLARKLESVYVVGLAPSGRGRYHYRASITARTLSDADVDEVYAWLKGNGARGVERERPGFLTRAARKVLVQVAPLPRLTLEGRTESFEVR